MKKFGLIGGCGPESTVPYYMNIVNGVKERVGKDFFPHMTIESVSCFEVSPMATNGQLEELTEYFLKAINNLKACGCDFAAIGCNTGHIVFDRLEPISPLPLVSIVTATTQEAQDRGYKKVLLLGTKATMEKDFFKDDFRRAGIEVAIPYPEDIEQVHAIIFGELEAGIVKPESVAFIKGIVEKMQAQEGIQAVVLGCTELPMLFQAMPDLQVPQLDTLAIHIDRIIKVIME